MVVCHCKAINADFLNSLLTSHALTAEEVTEQCGAGSDCGQCLDLIECMLAQRLTNQTDQTAHTTVGLPDRRQHAGFTRSHRVPERGAHR